MAADFRILFHKSENSLHLKLLGTLDGNSAVELLNALKVNSLRTSRLFIHTASLGGIDPFGLSLFRTRFDDLKSKSTSFVFTGEKASQLVPDGNGAVEMVE